ncbi:MAG: LysM peptidoglycan-binding domain-containing protein [Calditrichia bacterium]
MRKFYLISISLLIFLFMALNAFAQEYSYDYKKMSMDEYKTELAKWQKCEADNKAKIADEEAQISQLNSDIASTEKQTQDTWNEIYSMMGTDKQGYEDYLGQLKSLENELSGFVALSPEDIYSKRDEIDNFKQRLAELKNNKSSLTTESQNLISQIENLISQAEQKAQPAAAGMYEVARGDYLWKIAKKPDVYSNPYGWITIYTYNRDQIKNPDLIFPKQVLRIPKMAGPNEYWVQKGDFLYKIAGYSNIYGNSFKWQKIYEANKDVISDPNLIYPLMVLNIPKN